MNPVGVLVLSHGTPSSRGEVEAFYTRIRHGRPPTPELLDDLVRRYDAIGGLSPLTARTDAQVAGLARELNGHAGTRFVVEGATKYGSPEIEEGVERLVAAGVSSVVGLVLSPLNAPSSTDAYHHRAEAALAGRAGYRAVWSWWDAQGFAALVAARVHNALGEVGCATIVFTAHSLPARIPGSTEYGAQLAALSSAVAQAAGLADHLVCWQSAGKTGDEWLGPSLLEVIASLDPAEVRDVVVCPIGFVADHLEVLYDVDIEAASAARSRGISLRRTESLNDDPEFLKVLASVVEDVETRT